MQNVQFDEEKIQFIQKNNNTKMIDFLLKHKVFKNEKHAHIVIIGFIVLCAAISISLFTYATKAPKIKYNLSPSVINNLPPNVQKTIYESYK